MKLAIISLKSNSSNMLIEASKKYFSEVDALDLRHIEIVVREKAEIFYEDEPLKDYDCIYCRGSSKYALILRSITEILNKKAYMPLAPESFTIAHDKFLTQLYLQKLKVDMPRTYLAATTKRAKELIKRIHYPAIIKLPSGTHGKGVMFADSISSASSLLDALGALNQPFIIQEYVETGGTDIRALVVGDEVIAAMRRKALTYEKRANTHSGGTPEPVQLSREAINAALDTAKALQTDICGVDILEGPLGPLVIEANISPGLQGISKVSTIDIPEAIARFLYKKTEKVLAERKKEEADKFMKDIRNIEPITSQEIIATLQFRGERILLPEFITKIAGLSDRKEYTIKAEKGKVFLEEFNV